MFKLYHYILGKIQEFQVHLNKDKGAGNLLDEKQ
jgi:hypothetical protein